MKFNVPSKTLYNFAAAVSKVINAKNALTVLNNFLFTLEGNILTITAADMENCLTARVPVTSSEGEGSICLDARRLVDLLKELPDCGVEFDINDETMEVLITYLSGEYNTIGVPAAEYPTFDQGLEGELMTFSCPTEIVTKGIENTLFAVGNDDLRPMMMGILWDIKPDSIIFVATDTRKLVKYTNSNIQPGIEGSFILPLKSATVLKNVFAKEESVNITVSPKSILFESPSFTFNSRLIKGNFPDYNRVIPKSNPYAMTVNRVDLLNAVRRVGVFANGGNGLIKFKLTENLLTMKVQDTGFGTSGREMLACEYSDKDFIIGFGSAYLIEIFSTISSESVVMRLSDPSRPAVCTPDEDPEGTSMLVLLMPMNISDY